MSVVFQGKPLSEHSTDITETDILINLQTLGITAASDRKTYFIPPNQKWTIDKIKRGDDPAGYGYTVLKRVDIHLQLEDDQAITTVLDYSIFSKFFVYENELKIT